jgi:hypothetical protein
MLYCLSFELLNFRADEKLLLGSNIYATNVTQKITNVKPIATEKADISQMY